MTSDKKYYVYIHRKATDGAVFYVGKGQGKRAWKVNRSRYWESIIAKHGYTIHIIMRFESEKCAFSFERALIKFYGRENLCNLTDGGEGFSGGRHDDISKEKISNAGKGRIISERQREMASIANTGVIFSASRRAKISASNIGRRFNHKEETKEKMSQSSIKKPIKTACGKTFSSILEAVLFLRMNGFPKADNGNIVNCASGRRKVAYSYTWEYID